MAGKGRAVGSNDFQVFGLAHCWLKLAFTFTKLRAVQTRFFGAYVQPRPSRIMDGAVQASPSAAIAALEPHPARRVLVGAGHNLTKCRYGRLLGPLNY